MNKMIDNGDWSLAAAAAAYRSICEKEAQMSDCTSSRVYAYKKHQVESAKEIFQIMVGDPANNWEITEHEDDSNVYVLRVSGIPCWYFTDGEYGREVTKEDPTGAEYSGADVGGDLAVILVQLAMYFAGTDVNDKLEVRYGDDDCDDLFETMDPSEVSEEDMEVISDWKGWD